ncbi:hypothetical protein TNCV_332501 [Trichonephila clavipes]|nr:hypothetical protein TNCV_332501 [Trichonephila clavipes]
MENLMELRLRRMPLCRRRWVAGINLRSVERDLRVSLVNNGLVGPYSATVIVTLPSAPDHRPPRLAFAR